MNASTHSMLPLRRFIAAGLAAVLCCASAPPALAVDFTWDNTAGGNWSDPNNWTPGGGPPTTLGNTAHIDNDALNNVTVFLDINAAINSLTVDLSDTLSFNDGFDLNVNSGTFLNNGQIDLNSSGSLTDLLIGGSITLGGSGEIVMGNNANNRILASTSQIVTHASTHTIRGAGQLLSDLGGMINDGTITAIGSTALTINPATQGFTNTGTMQAMGTGGFVFDGTGGGIDTFTNTGQIIDILAGSKLDLINNAVVSGGTLAVTGSGVINPLGVGGVILEGVTITDTDTASATVVQGDDQLVTIVTGLTNDGKWEMNSTGSATVTPPSRRAAPARLSWATTPTTAFSRHFHRS